VNHYLYMGLYMFNFGVATIAIHILYCVQNLLSWLHLTKELLPYLKWVTNAVFWAVLRWSGGNMRKEISYYKMISLDVSILMWIQV
jgi:hypothetical protein